MTVLVSDVTASIIQVTHTSSREHVQRTPTAQSHRDLWRMRVRVESVSWNQSRQHSVVLTECRTRSESVRDSGSALQPAPTHGLTPNARDTSARLGLIGGELPAQAAPSHLISFTARRWVDCCCHLRSGPTCDGLQRPRRCRRCHPFAKRAAKLIRRHRRSQR